MYTRELTSRNTSELWSFLLSEASSARVLVLVNNLLMERELRRKWQRYRKELSPDIQTMESWFEELALHSLQMDELPGLILHNEERTLWLEQWLSGHPDADFQRFSGVKTVTAISNIIGNLHRQHQQPDKLLDFLQKNEKKSGGKGASNRYIFADILVAYEKEKAGRNWLDREQLIGRMRHVSGHMVQYEKIVLYHPDEPDILQERALQLVSKVENAPELVSIRFDDRDEKLVNSDDRESEKQANGPVFIEQFHHPKEELEAAVRHILVQIAAYDRDEPVRHREGAIPRFDDFVILAGDLSLYESLAGSVAERFGVPLYSSRGMALISHPFIRRLLTYMKLDHNGFQIDDVFRVFADNRVVLPDLEHHDEQKPPNIRHFSQFCRAYNFRTLEEVSAGMDRVFDRLLTQIHFEEDEEREQKRIEALKRDREFYISVIKHLESFRKYYKTAGRQNLNGWVDWALSLLDIQKDLMSREANEVRELLVVILEKIAEAQEKLGLNRDFSRFDFFKLLDLRLKETRERLAERPGGILLTEIRHLPDVHDKTVFILGLHEEGFPATERLDFLQYRYEWALQAITGRDGSESYDTGRMQLQRILASEHPRYLSRPALADQKNVMPSPLWLELEDEMRRENRAHVDSNRNGCNKSKIQEGWPDERKKWLISAHDLGIGVVSGRMLTDDISRQSGSGNVDWNTIRRFQLAYRTENERKDPVKMGSYDGVIDSGIMEKWWNQQFADSRLPMSISRLDTFASSPQDYFYKYILRLQPLYEYQDDAESNIKGSLLHQILQEFYSDTPEEGPPVHPADDLQGAQKRMNAIRVRLIESYRHQLGNPDSPFPEILTRNLEQVTRWFVEMESVGYPDFTEGLEGARPAVFFPDSGLTMEHQWGFEKIINGISVDFRGMIDRIDLTSDRERGVIFDYKSGRSGVKRYRDILKGRSFQLPVYGMYIRSQGIPIYLAGYYQLPVNGRRKDTKIAFALGSAEVIRQEKLYNRTGKRNRYMLQYKPADEMHTFLEAIEDLRIAWIVRAVREGRYHVSLTGDPKWSDFRYINRYDERIQHMRSNRERTNRNEKGLKFELDRYYLAEPFWEDTDE